MASSTSNDDGNSLDFADINSDGSDWTEQSEYDKSDENDFSCDYRRNVNFVSKLISRQIHGRFTNHPRSKTEPFFRDVYCNCRFKLDHIIPKGVLNHIFMGFSLCGKFFFSYSGTPSDSETTGPMNLFPTVEYEVFIWSFVPGQKLRLISKHRIFKLFKSVGELRKVSFMQFPSDPCKLICYGTGSQTPEMAFLTILTLPFPKNCRNCKENLSLGRDCPSHVTEGWCLKHGFILHYMFSLAHPSPPFDPHISLAYPDHIVINTGHYVHILNVSTYKPPQRTVMSFNNEKFEENKMTPHTNLSSSFPDTLSDLSESPSELFSNHSIVDMILEDFSEYDLEDSLNKSHTGLLIIDSKTNADKPRWIKKVVRRYSSVDFENSSLVSGQSRDDYNIPIEIPLLVQTLTEQHLDVVPEFKSDQITETQLIVTQRTFDCEQFVQGRAQKLCIDAQLEFSHCEDYDVRIVHICPLNGHIVCKALIKIGAIQTSESCGKPRLYLSNCLFSWNISSDSFDIIESVEHSKLQPSTKKINLPELVIPNIVHKKVHIMDHLNTSKCSLRDYNNCFEICMDNKFFCKYFIIVFYIQKDQYLDSA
ncbi:DDB1- and CUL4-associated factor 15 [Agrilus planipennis]|uniref:DDB1- and CUL4-associated factor 15 n=1 Tax=Agrilus planipennis TaxID=224129 RepID=A0A1W4WYW1_AGRPL|nr:DDB1- and CUL4-associated factor 15 [Agrilus planipennis]